MSWDDSAEGWDDDPAVRAYCQGALRSLQQLTAVEGARVLDFGCGTGLLSRALASRAARIVAVDASPAMLAVLRRRLATEGIDNVQVVGKLTQAGEAFDLVLCSSVLAFVPDLDSTVAELVGRLVPGGRLVQWDWELDSSTDEPFGLTREQIHGALQAAGLAEVHVDIGFRQDFEGHTMAPLMGTGIRPPTG